MMYVCQNLSMDDTKVHLQIIGNLEEFNDCSLNRLEAFSCFVNTYR